MNNFLKSEQIINSTQPKNQDLQQHNPTNDDILTPNMSMSTNNKISPNSTVDIVNPNTIQKDTINQINNNKKQNNIINNNSEHNTTSNNIVNNVNLAEGGG